MSLSAHDRMRIAALRRRLVAAGADDATLDHFDAQAHCAARFARCASVRAVWSQMDIVVALAECRSAVAEACQRVQEVLS